MIFFVISKKLSILRKIKYFSDLFRVTGEKLLNLDICDITLGKKASGFVTAVRKVW